MTLKGFKSFADSTVLDFEPGVAVVVGPNGSGKSNVVDAIAWVLGAQAPASVRSQKMDDVIFAGTAKRPALGRAEVALTIDNTARILPIDFEEVTIKRTLFRDGESEYSMNEIPCRLLDIQELLSDTGVGRHQHVIVSQGQIDAVLNAKPEERRTIIEEAAGILKYRRRKEKSQRRLKASEENLTRLQDLVREVKRQLKPLERQAEAARTHGTLASELSTLQVHLVGKEIKSLREAISAIQAGRQEQGATERDLRAELTTLDSDIETAEDQLASTGTAEASDQLVLAEGLRERAKGLRALLSERIAGLERDLDRRLDGGVVETLEAEAARLLEELQETYAKAKFLEPSTLEVAEAEKDLQVERNEFQQKLFEDISPNGVEAAEARGKLAAISSSIEMIETNRNQLHLKISSLKEDERNSNDLLGELAKKMFTIDAQKNRLAKEIDTLLKSKLEAEAEWKNTDELLAEAKLESKAWVSRADALSEALDQARKSSGVEELSELNGVIGTLLELIEIDEGWEAALEAAIGSSFASVVVQDFDIARRALEALRSEQLSGGVIAVGAPEEPGVRGTLRAHVRSSIPSVERLLDNLLKEIDVVEDWASGVAMATLKPKNVFVTPDGDRFAPDGWRVGTIGTAATGSALEEALSQSEDSIAAVRQLEKTQNNCMRIRKEAERALENCRNQLKMTERDYEEIKDAHSRNESDLRALRVEIEGLELQGAEIIVSLEEQVRMQEELSHGLPELETFESEVMERSKIAEKAGKELDRKAIELGERRTNIETQVAANEERKQFLENRLEDINKRLDGYAVERSDAENRRVHLERKLRLAEFLRSIVEKKSSVVEDELKELRRIRQEQSAAAQAAVGQLDIFRKARSKAEEDLAKVREGLHRSELQEAESTLKLEAAIDALRRDHDCEPGVAVSTDCPELEGATPKGRVRELERELKIMGPVNPLALEEFEALHSRWEFLVEQLEDVKESRRELNKVIRAIDKEIIAVFSSAFSDVAANFELLFSSLFPGGVGGLKLTEPNNLLETGIEIEAKPSGKNVKKLSLLSGGERSLTSLAFLFSIFRSRPSPFYVLDEVEAALDDVNLQRFLQLIREFRGEAQLIIVSHQKRTMEAADCVYGVTMQPGGSTRVLSEKPAQEPTLIESHKEVSLK
tara:strand:+ start:938 stop:4408 length:3471 start_codon:yes stop_codon:yes gene_type:complete